MFRPCTEMTKHKYLLPLLILFAVEATSHQHINHRRPILDYKSEYDNGDLVAQSSTTTVRWLPPPGKGAATHFRNYREPDQMYQASATSAVTSSAKAPPKVKKMIKSPTYEMSDALANTETAAEYVSTALKMWNGPTKPTAAPEASKKSLMKYDVFDPKQAAELLHMNQFDHQLYQVPQSMQSMQIPTHYVQPTQYVLEPVQYEEQEPQPQHYHPTTMPPQQMMTLQPVVQKRPQEVYETEPPSTPAPVPRYARPAIRKPSRPVRQKAAPGADNGYDTYQNVVSVTKPEPFELPTKAPVHKEVTAESQRSSSSRYPTSTYTVESGGETHIHHHYAPVQHQQYEDESDVQEVQAPSRPKYVTPRARPKPSTHNFQIQHLQAVTEEPATAQEFTTSYRTPAPYQHTLKATSRPLAQSHQSQSHFTHEIEKELASQSYQIEIPRDELIKHIEESVNKYLKNMNFEEKLARERPRQSYVPRSQQHVTILSTTPPPITQTTTALPTTPRPVKVPRRRRPVVIQQPQQQQENSHDHQEQHIIVSNEEYLPPSFVLQQSHPHQVQQQVTQHVPQHVPQHVQQHVPQHVQQHVPQHVQQHVPQHVTQQVPHQVTHQISHHIPNQISHQEPIVVTQPTKIYTYEESSEQGQEHVYRQPKVVHQEQYQAQYPSNNELSRESVVHSVDLTDQNPKHRPNHIDLSALDVGQSWSHGTTFDHSAALKNLQGFDQSNAVLQPDPQPKLHFNSQTYHDINALNYNPNRDFVSTVEPPVAASTAHSVDSSTTFFKKQSFGPAHNTVNVNEGSASVGASISVGAEQNVPGLRDEQVKAITDELGPVHIINGLPVVNPYNIDLHTLKFMLGSPMAPGNVQIQTPHPGPSSVSEVPPPNPNKPRKGTQFTRDSGWTNVIRPPVSSGSNVVQYKYTGNDLPTDSYSPKYNNNPKGEGYQTTTHNKMHNAHQNGSQFAEVLNKGRVKVVEVVKATRGKRHPGKGKEPDTELKPPPRFPKYN